MKVIEPDHERLYEIAGVAGAARRPVDIDSSKTGFECLRSLRVYRFPAGTVIDGHAEDDEVFVVVTKGDVEMKIGWEDSAVDAAGTYTLAAPYPATGKPFVAYLPPRAVYQLTANTTADVAYARATPQGGLPPAVFCADLSAVNNGVTTLLAESKCAQRLQLKVVSLKSLGNEVIVDLLSDAAPGCEALVHVQTSPADNACSISIDGNVRVPLQTWGTAAIEPGERAVLHVPPQTTALVLTVLAT